MKKFIFFSFTLFIGVASVFLFNKLSQSYAAATPEKISDVGTIINVKMETSMGDVMLEIYPDRAPETVKNFLYYTNNGLYDGTIFHRVMKGFMNQGGGFTTDYKKKSTQAPIPNEAFNDLKNLRGTIAMARTGQPHSATNQFFINTVDNHFLNHTGKNATGWGYAVFGKVSKGMDVMDKIANVQTGSTGPFAQNAPLKQVIITKMSEVKAKSAPVKTDLKPTE